jgi:hypothetical protein
MKKANGKALAPRANLGAMDRTRLRLESSCDIGTIGKWANGHQVREATHLRLTKACQRLGIELLK